MAIYFIVNLIESYIKFPEKGYYIDISDDILIS